jgi:DNA-binding CsgD family transcriptional regulator
VPQSIRLEVQDPVLRLALRHVASEFGHRVVQDEASVVRVSDQVPTNDGAVDVLAAPASPLGCRIALGALVAGVTTAVISARRPEDLGGALEAIQHDLVSVPIPILAQAHRLPDLSPRHHQILGCLAAGITRDAAIARRLAVSLATVKRSVYELYDTISAPGRPDLAAEARDMGYTRPMTGRLLTLATMFDLRQRAVPA